MKDDLSSAYSFRFPVCFNFSLVVMHSCACVFPHNPLLESIVGSCFLLFGVAKDVVVGFD